MTEPPVSFPYCSADATLVDLDQIPGGSLASKEGDPSFLASNKTLWWRNGKRIRVRFLNGTKKVQERVMYWASTWERFANVDFRLIPDGDADIRVGFKWRNPGFGEDLGTWSYVGTSARKIEPNQNKPTMNFGDLTEESTDDDFCRHVTHEFGHAIGCVHEHQSRLIKWDEQYVIADCKKRYKWSEEQTRAQILRPEANLNLLYKSEYDTKSIMCYWYPPEWTMDHSSAPLNQKLSDTDKSFINNMYPFQTRNSGELSLYPDIRDRSVPTQLNSKEVSFNPPYPLPPYVAIGLKSLEMSNAGDIRVRTTAQSILEDKFTVNMDAGGDSQLFNASSTWIEFAQTADSEYEVGDFNTLEIRQLGDFPTPDEKNVLRDRQHFDFPEDKYKEPPNVLVWLSALEMNKAYNWRARAKATNVTTIGFDLDIETWGDTKLYSAAASWFAYPKDSESATSGRASTSDVRNWFPAVAKNQTKVNFPPKFFDKVPKVYLAISELDIDSSANLQVKVYADKLKESGFTWHGDAWDGSKLYTISADWIAFG